MEAEEGRGGVCTPCRGRREASRLKSDLELSMIEVKKGLRNDDLASKRINMALKQLENA